MKFEYDTYTLSNGKSFDANNGILGLGENITIYEGYDGEVCESFSREERQEIGEFMIDKWSKWINGKD